LHKSIHKKISHEKDAKAQSAAAFLKAFSLRLCAFAPLREKYFFTQMYHIGFEQFLCKTCHCGFAQKLRKSHPRQWVDRFKFFLNENP
jgi:hypothetical protein